MSVWQFSLAIGALISAVVAMKLPRSSMWIAIMAGNFILCTVYARSGLSYPPAFTLALDTLTCLAIDYYAREKWELRLFNIYQISVLISVLRLFGIVDSKYIYVLSLELCNWLALLLIGGTAVLDRIRRHDHSIRHRWRVLLHSSYHYLRSSRPTNHWRKVR